MHWRRAFVILCLQLNFICTEKDCAQCLCCKGAACTGRDSRRFPCTGCIDGYSGPSCTKPCPLNCINCSQLFYEDDSERICYQCKAGYYNGRHKDIPSYPIQLDCHSQCIDNCVTCTSYYNCKSCAANHYLVNGIYCRLCPLNCRRCVSDTECVACFEGYVWTGAECEQCPSNCKNCTSSERCSECNSGYYSHEGFCKKCPSGCLSCNGTQTCDKCQEEYILTDNSCREKCSNCKIGSACDNSTGYCLDSCKDKLSGKKCDIPCNSNCSTCEQDNPETCITCADDKYGSSCHNQCPANCVSNTCNDGDGACSYGCAVGCWGKQCEQDCPVNCAGRKCKEKEGTCSDRCNANYKGDKCDCPINCECDANGNCTECLPGYTGLNCSVTGSEVKENGGGAGIGVAFCILAVMFLVAAIATWRFRKRIKERLCVVIDSIRKQLVEPDEITNTVESPETRAEISSENVLLQPTETLKLKKSSHKFRAEKCLVPRPVVISLKSRDTGAAKKTDIVDELEVATVPKLSRTRCQEGIALLDTGEVGMNGSLHSLNMQAEPAVKSEENFLDIQTKKSSRMNLMENQNCAQSEVQEGFQQVRQQGVEQADKRGDILVNVAQPTVSKDTTEHT